jgi:hypothetical protein
MNYKKYEVRSPLFALKDPQVSEAVLAIFSGFAPRPAAPQREMRTVRVFNVKRSPR